MNAEIYLERLDQLTGGREPEYRMVPSTSALPPVAVMIYREFPEAGLTTAFTYGVSEAEYPDWTLARPELVSCVRTQDEAWAMALGAMAERYRGICSFHFGATFDMRKPISKESEMSAFLIFAPSVIDPQFSRVRVGERLIDWIGAYPIHKSEIWLIEKIGVDRFWDSEFDPYDVTRAPINLGNRIITPE
jgi:hypothetical protein